MIGNLNKIYFSRFIVVFGVVLGLFHSCHSVPKNQTYSFFIGGHVYGSVTDTALGLYPPLIDLFPALNEDSTMWCGFFNGDIVQKSTPEAWQQVEGDISQLNFPVHFIPGNHDVRGSAYYAENYGPTYSAFTYQNDLFILLDGNLDQWNIKGNQFRFLEETLAENAEVDNVFILVHQIIHYDYFPIQPNSETGKADELSFEAEVLPLLKNTKKSVYIFTGDVGGLPWVDSYTFGEKDGITFVASGMGSGKADNLLIVTVNEKKEVFVNPKFF